ncbi:glucan endo-1,3-beta-glucosidase 12-like [Mangifera indica]|uniref:glucan endo-1,3-beta-glucosidase 12-like n=1 Tax=Mangifera indica TaxID=29780 RepID=UPI001CF943AC|nr:glucan endo-1,3-beta-glucosidase 12-like [Mangifera indica]
MASSSTFPLQCFTILLLYFVLTSGSSVAEKPEMEGIQKARKLENVGDPLATQFDTTVPIINPTNSGNNPNTPFINAAANSSPPPPPTTTMTPITNPTPYTTPPASSGGQWCIASPTASETALQTALDYTCGYGGADCSQIQPGASCYNPNTVRDHASFAFNNYYHKNPAPTSCVFGGAAQLTSTDPSNGNCHYPSTTGSTPPANITPPANPTPTIANPPPSPTTTNPYITPTGLPSSATSVPCSLLLLAATGFICSLLAENYL